MPDDDFSGTLPRRTGAVRTSLPDEIICLDHERLRFWIEMRRQTQVYGQFLEHVQRAPIDAGAD